MQNNVMRTKLNKQFASSFSVASLFPFFAE